MKSIKSLLSHVWAIVNHLISTVAAELRDIILPGAIKIVGTLDTVLAIDANDMAGGLFGAIGKQYEDMAKKWLPIIFLDLGLAETKLNHKNPDGSLNILEVTKDLDSIIQQGLANLKIKSVKGLASYKHMIAVLLADYEANGKISFSDAIFAVEGLFQELKTAKAN